MTQRLVATTLILGLFLVGSSRFVDAQEPPADSAPVPADGGDEPPEPPTAPQPQPKPEAAAPSFPDDPRQRLELAAEAFRRADYGALVPLLEPLAATPSPLESREARVEARELLGVGHFFRAQQTTNPAARAEAMAAAEAVFLELLREKPDHALDELIFPASVVELFESVRTAHAEELDKLLAAQEATTTSGEMQTLYIERVATRRIYWLNFLPFGVGQFQNGHYAKGTALALLQVAGLAVNVGSFWVIVRGLQNPETGLFDADAGSQNSPYANALRWRRNLYIGLGGFIGMWVLSAVDGVLNFERESVRIRTLDGPPPELGAPPAEAGAQPAVPLGLAIQWQW